jgi:hypothetical protein
LLSKHGFEFYISIDSEEEKSLVLPPACASVGIQFLSNTLKPVSDFDSTPTGRIARHFKFATSTVFKKHSHAIFLEDDLLPSKDFVSLFVPPSPAFALLEEHGNQVG